MFSNEPEQTHSILAITFDDVEFLASCPHLEAQKWLPPWRSIIQFALQIRQRNTVSDKGTESAATLCYTATKVGQPVSVSLLLGCPAPLVDSWLTTSSRAAFDPNARASWGSNIIGYWLITAFGFSQLARVVTWCYMMLHRQVSKVCHFNLCNVWQAKASKSNSILK